MMVCSGVTLLRLGMAFRGSLFHGRIRCGYCTDWFESVDKRLVGRHAIAHES
jgi:hypothetical protein